METNEVNNSAHIHTVITLKTNPPCQRTSTYLSTIKWSRKNNSTIAQTSYTTTAAHMHCKKTSYSSTNKLTGKKCQLFSHQLQYLNPSLLLQCTQASIYGNSIKRLQTNPHTLCMYTSINNIHCIIISEHKKAHYNILSQ